MGDVWVAGTGMTRIGRRAETLTALMAEAAHIALEQVMSSRMVVEPRAKRRVAPGVIGAALACKKEVQVAPAQIRRCGCLGSLVTAL